MTENSKGYESTDASPRRIVMAGMLLLAGLVLIMAVAGWWLKSESTHPADQEFSSGASYRTSIREDRDRANLETSAHLHDYRWLDPDSGRIQIPIEAAMEAIAKEAANPP